MNLEKVRDALRRFGVSSLNALPGILLVALATFICFASHANQTIAAFVYLILVVLQALASDFAASAIVSFTAVLCLDYFFTLPLYSLGVANPIDIIMLVSFLATGLIITRLTSEAKERANVAELQRQEMKQLYTVAQRLLSLQPDIEPPQNLLAPFAHGFGLQAICLLDASTLELYQHGDASEFLAGKTREAYSMAKNSDDASATLSIRLLRASGTITGAIAFQGLRDPALTADPLASLAAAMLERSRAFRQASHAAALKEVEVFRGAVLDAMAHEFKTPLAIMLTAMGALREAGSISTQQSDLAEIIETETSRLSRLVSRLLRMARLDQEEVKPDIDLTDFSDLVKEAVSQCSHRWTDRRVLLLHDQPAQASCDAELLRLAVSQLLENACKYSKPGSHINASIESKRDKVALRIQNTGSTIAAGEEANIFERFYRGKERRNQAPGSGLGLYVARKIAEAHGGSLELEKQIDPGEGPTFRLTLPISMSELHYDNKAI